MAPRGYIKVVGESHYQDDLKRLLGAAPPKRVVTVGVEREPTNQFDPKAIRIFDPANGRTLGYLPRGTTGLARLLKGGGIERTAQIKGGTSAKPSIGLVLHLYGEQEEPEEASETEWESALPPRELSLGHVSDPAPDAALRDSQEASGGLLALLRRLFGR